MATTSRYNRTPRLSNGGTIGTTDVHVNIRLGVESGRISSTSQVVREGERLDTLAGSYYGDAGYWWIIAAASGIGWGLQIPPGTIVRIPDLMQVLSYVR